jgi:hypothetical protein
MSYVQPLSGVVECALEQAQRRMLSQKEEAVLMISGLQMGARRGTVDKATCDHYAYPVWVSVVGTRHRASCWGARRWGRWPTRVPWPPGRLSGLQGPTQPDAALSAIDMPSDRRAGTIGDVRCP